MCLFVIFSFQVLTYSIQDRLLPENFEIPAWKPPTELDLANAPSFPQQFHKTPKKSPAPLSTIAQQLDDHGSSDSEEEDEGEGETELLRPATPAPPYVSFLLIHPPWLIRYRSPPPKAKGKRTRSTTKSALKSTEYVNDSDNESVPASKVFTLFLVLRPCVH